MKLYNAFYKPFFSKALRYGSCVTMGSHFYLPPTHEPYHIIVIVVVWYSSVVLPVILH